MNGLKLLAETFGREEVDGFSDGLGLVGDGADGESRNGEDGGASRFHVARILTYSSASGRWLWQNPIRTDRSSEDPPEVQRGYLIIPRSELSINRISLSTSSPGSGSDFNFSSACEVFIFDASRTLYAW